MGKLDVKGSTLGVSLEDLLLKLPADEQAAVQARGDALIAREMSLRDLRRALGQTQVAMADRLGIKQENVSRIEKRSDMLLSTLNAYLREMGGRLRLVAEFDGRPAVELKGLADLPESPPGIAGARKRKSRTAPSPGRSA